MKTLLAHHVPLLLLSTIPVSAHFALVQPPSALSIEDGGKGDPPCAAGPASNIITNAQGGHPISLQLTEFVFHPGHYRIALSVKSRAELPRDPDVLADDDGISVSASIQNPPRIPVLADGLFAHTVPPSGDWTTSLVLPNLDCERCTLQIIEFMAEHGPNQGGGYFYHHCSDLRITSDAKLPPADAAWTGTALSPVIGTFPHLISSPNLSTGLTLFNKTSLPASATIRYRYNDGSDSFAQVTVRPNGVARSQPDASQTKAWAQVRSDQPLGGYAVIRSTGDPPFEAVLPIAVPTSGQFTLPYENHDDVSTSVVVINGANETVAVNLTVWDEDGNRTGSRSVVMDADSRTEVILSALFPQTAGLTGLIRIEGSAGSGLTAIAVRTSSVGIALLPQLP